MYSLLCTTSHKDAFGHMQRTLRFLFQYFIFSLKSTYSVWDQYRDTATMSIIKELSPFNKTMTRYGKKKQQQFHSFTSSSVDTGHLGGSTCRIRLRHLMTLCCPNHQNLKSVT